MAAKYLLPALAIAGRAAAQSCSGTTTISTQAQATGLASCQQWTGNIVIGPSTSQPIDISGIARIDGSLIAKNIHKLTALTANTLSTISDTFEMVDVTALTSLTFPSLVSVDTIAWTGLASLQGLSFTQGVQKAANVEILNTQLSSLDGITLEMVDTLILADNPFLNTVDLPLANVTKGLGFASNGPDLSISLPNLIWANDAAFRNVTKLSIPSLATINGSLGFYSSFFTSLFAPNLTTVGQELAFVSNDHLSTLDFNSITAVGGGFQVANNTDLTDFSGFKSLKDVGGAIDMFGTFKSITLPALAFVRGAFDVESTGDITSSCNNFQKLSSSKAIRGVYTCKGSQGDAAKSGTGSSSSSGSSGSSSSGKSGANSLLIPYATGIIGVVAAIFGML